MKKKSESANATAFFYFFAFILLVFIALFAWHWIAAVLWLAFWFLLFAVAAAKVAGVYKAEENRAQKEGQ